MEITIFLKVGFEPAALALLERLAGGGAAVAAAPKAEPVAEAGGIASIAEVAGVAAPTAAPTAAPVAAGPSVFSEAEAREAVFAAIDRTRRRIEGEDWESNPGSELRMRYHAAVTAKCKEIAARVAKTYPSCSKAVTRPSELEPYMSRAFCDALDALTIEGGVLTEGLPF